MLYGHIRKNAIILAIMYIFLTFHAISEKISDVEVKRIEKYEKWKEVFKDPSNYIKTFSFFYHNPHWPLFDEFSRKAEEHIAQNDFNPILVKWFKRYPPKTSNGVISYIDVLLKNDEDLAIRYIKQTWIFQNLSPEFSIKFRKRYNKYISRVEDANRVKRLISQKQYPQLEAMKKIASKQILGYIKQYLKRTLKTDSGKYKVEDLDDIDMKYNIIQSLIKAKKDKEAADILVANNENEEKYENNFFDQRRSVACNMLRAGKPELAYKVLRLCKIEKTKKNMGLYIKSQWLLGFIAYRFLNHYDDALKHFENAYNYSKDSVKLSKSAFWIAEVCRSKNDEMLALEWYKKASKQFHTFYGYLAYDRLHELSKEEFLVTDDFYSGTKTKVPLDEELIFFNRELVQVLKAVFKNGGEKNKKIILLFFEQLIKEIENPKEELLLLNLASSDEETKHLIFCASGRQKYFNNIKAYKVLEDDDLHSVKMINNDPCFISLVHSIIHRESNFDINAKSKVGAVGLMQVMPKTADFESKYLRFYLGKNVSLFNKQKNITIGASILNRGLEKYKNNLVYVIAAYNCGDGNIAKFRKSIKNLKNLTYIDLIELIPIKETRIYVKHVLHSMFIYEKMFKKTKQKCYNCKTISDLKIIRA